MCEFVITCTHGTHVWAVITNMLGWGSSAAGPTPTWLCHSGLLRIKLQWLQGRELQNRALLRCEAGIEAPLLRARRQEVTIHGQSRLPLQAIVPPLRYGGVVCPATTSFWTWQWTRNSFALSVKRKGGSHTHRERESEGKKSLFDMYSAKYTYTVHFFFLVQNFAHQLLYVLFSLFWRMLFICVYVSEGDTLSCSHSSVPGSRSG